LGETKKSMTMEEKGFIRYSGDYRKAPAQDWRLGRRREEQVSGKKVGAGIWGRGDFVLIRRETKE